MNVHSHVRFFIVTRWLVFALVIGVSGCVAVDWVDSQLSYSKVVHAKPIPLFTVPPKVAGTRYLQFEAVGDFGTGLAGERDIAAAMARKADTDSISFVLVLGDNFYESGVESVSDQQWRSTFEDMFSQPSLNVPFYAVLGNHDYWSNPQAQVEYTRFSTRWNMPARYFTVQKSIDDSTDVEIFCLDTDPLAYLSVGEAKSMSDSAQERTQLRWLEDGLRRSAARWKIVIGHHTVYSGGEHGDNETLQVLLEPLFVKYAVDFYVCGHDHDQELLKPIHGVNYIVSGAGAKHRDVRWRDNTEYAETNLGFTFFRISRTETVVEFLTRAGVTEFAHVFRKDTP